MRLDARPMTAAVEFDRITCAFATAGGEGKAYTAVKDVTLCVAQGEFVSGVGPTGCGKSTLLNVAAGLLKPSAGAMRRLGEPPFRRKPRARYIFQSQALMPGRPA